MSTEGKNYDVSICANCGKGEEESNKLKACTACKMVKYCSRECQIAHRSQHKKECRKRAAELHDEKLFKQPPPDEDCPICFLLLPTLESGRKYQTCCGKMICSGCTYAPVYDDQGNVIVEGKCSFCRTPNTYSDEELDKRMIGRIEAGDTEAMYKQGIDYFEGANGLPQDHTKALEYWHRAAELGHAASYCHIGCAHDNGEGVDVDEKKANHYYELAAMRGDVSARYNLGINEMKTGNIARALKHYMIAARAGDSDSLKQINRLYTYGRATKDDYTKALKLYQEYLGEIKSSQRDEAAAYDNEEYRYY